MAVVLMVMIVIMAVVTMLMVVIMAVVTMLMVVILLYVGKIDLFSFYGIQNFLSAQLLYRSRNNCGIRVQLAYHRNGGLYFLRRRFLHIRSAQNNGACRLHLILEKFTEIFQVHFAFQDINNRNCTVELHAVIQIQIFHCMDNI